MVQQFGGGKRNRSQQNRNRNRSQQNRQQQNRNRNRQQQNRNRNRSQQNRNRNRQQQNRSRKQKQRGGALGYGEAVPASGNYTLLNPQELKAAGLNPQWFDENQVNPSFGGALTVPGGK
jgi:predicted Zn-dependent protease